MIKIFTLIIAIVFCVIFQAEAIVKQKASNALSYRNTVSGSSVINSGIGLADLLPETTSEEGIRLKEVDLQNNFSEDVKINMGEEFYVLLREDDNYVWEISYDTNNVIMIENSLEGSIRKIRFSQRGSGDSSIYFDKKTSSGEVIQNKAIYIKVY